MTIGLLVVLVASALCFPCTVPAATPVHPAATSATGGSGSAALAPHRRHVVPQEASAADAKIWPEFVSLMKSGRISEEHLRPAYVSKPTLIQFLMSMRASASWPRRRWAGCPSAPRAARHASRRRP